MPQELYDDFNYCNEEFPSFLKMDRTPIGLKGIDITPITPDNKADDLITQ